MILAMLRAFFLGICGAFIVTLILWQLIGLAVADDSSRVYDATIGQQDRSLTVSPEEYEGYDNSDFLRDMDAIARGTYIAPVEPDSEEAEDE